MWSPSVLSHFRAGLPACVPTRLLPGSANSSADKAAARQALSQFGVNTREKGYLSHYTNTEKRRLCASQTEEVTQTPLNRTTMNLDIPPRVARTVCSASYDWRCWSLGVSQALPWTRCGIAGWYKRVKPETVLPPMRSGDCLHRARLTQPVNDTVKHAPLSRFGHWSREQDLNL